jgi:hypothetical protein
MLIYPLNKMEARIQVPKIGIEGVHRCRISLLSDIMDLIENHKVEVYDGEDFIASRKRK